MGYVARRTPAVSLVLVYGGDGPRGDAPAEGPRTGVVGRRRLLAATAAGVGVGWIAPAILSAPARAATTAPACVPTSGNLITCAGGTSLANPPCFLGDADEDPNPPVISGTPPLLSPPWTVTNGLRVCDYGHTAMPTTGNLSPPSPSVGTNLFCGSFSGGASPASATQLIDVSSFSTSIDAGTAGYVLSGYLGGNPTVSTTATFSATFLSISMTTLGSGSLPPLDSSTLSTTGLIQDCVEGTVPVNTRYVRVELGFAYPGISAPPRNTACADLLSFELC